jgi:predicted dehydrogenase
LLALTLEAELTSGYTKSVDKLTVSFVGGGTGGRLSLDAAAASTYYQLTALADLRPEVCAELGRQYPQLQTFTDFREMLQAWPTDLVCVSTYPPSHELVTLEALKLPLKAPLVEKPLGHSFASGRRILEAVQQRNIPMAVPHGLMVKRCPLATLKICFR